MFMLAVIQLSVNYKALLIFMLLL